MSILSRAALAASILVVAAAPGQAFETPVVSAHLLAAGTLPDGTYRAALDLTIPQGWHTYWHNPGDAGIPPMFDFSGSSNLASAEVSYPAPERYSDGTSTSMVYTGRVLFPLTVRPATAGTPVSLSLRLMYGLCSEVCLPADAELSVDLDPAAVADPATVADVATFLARVPVPASGGAELRDLRFDVATSSGTATLAVDGAGDLVDTFVTADDPWFVAPPEPTGRDGSVALYRIAIGGPRNGGAPQGVGLRVTRVGTKGVVEIPLRIQ